MRESEQTNMNALIDSLDESNPSTLFITDNEGNVLLSNDFTALTLGMNLHDLLHSNIYDLVAKGVYNKSAALQTIQTKKKEEVFLETNQGYCVKSTATPIFYNDGTLHMIVTKSEPITSKQLEEWHKRNPTLTSYLKSDLPIEQASAVVAESKEMKKLLRICNQIAPYDTRILFTGESGVGKEVLAQFTHKQAMQEKRPFISLNCAAIPENLFESEIFGFEKGAFTGADAPKKGLLELANNGTLFLDEISEMPLAVQSKFLRVLETMEMRRLGGEKTVHVNFRLISASNVDIEALVHEHKFRKDLYYRINVMPINIPPLRKRKQDVLVLAHHFLQKFNEKHQKNIQLDAEVSKKLLNDPWIGNVRELRNCIERLVILDGLSPFIIAEESSCNAEEPMIAYQHLDYEHYLQKVEYSYFLNKLEKNEWNISQTAKECGISRPLLYKKIKQFNFNQLAARSNPAP